MIAWLAAADTIQTAMAKKKKTVGARRQPLLIETTETEAGLEWLRSMTEDQVRDKVLVELFRRMRTEAISKALRRFTGATTKGWTS